MKTRGQTIKLPHGDVRELRIYRNKRTTRLVVYDEDWAVPLIQAKLGATESARRSGRRWGRTNESRSHHGQELGGVPALFSRCLSSRDGPDCRRGAVTRRRPRGISYFLANLTFFG